MNRTNDRARWPITLTRVVFVVHRHPELGGVSTVIDNLTPSLIDRGVDVEIISLWPGHGPAKHPVSEVFRHEQLHAAPLIRHRGRTWTRLGLLPLVAYKRWDRRRALARLRRRISSYGPETVVIVTGMTSTESLRLSGYVRTASAPYLVGQYHNSFRSLLRQPGQIDRFRREYSDMDAFVALTQADADEFAKLVPIPCFAVANPLAHASSNAQGDVRERVAIAVARFAPEKQLDVMIRAFVRATNHPALAGWTLRIYGEGSERPNMECAIQQTGALDRVHLMGYTANASAAFATARINLVTSAFEGLPLSIMEAAQCGVPTLAYDCSPGVAMLAQRLSGVLSPAGDEDAFVDKLREMLLNEADLEQRGTAARVAVADFEADAIVDDWAETLQRVLSASRGKLA